MLTLNPARYQYIFPLRKSAGLFLHWLSDLKLSLWYTPFQSWFFSRTIDGGLGGREPVRGWVLPISWPSRPRPPSILTFNTICSH